MGELAADLAFDPEQVCRTIERCLRNRACARETDSTPGRADAVGQ